MMDPNGSAQLKLGFGKRQDGHASGVGMTTLVRVEPRPACWLAAA
jgi:hypothetical protein